MAISTRQVCMNRYVSIQQHVLRRFTENAHVEIINGNCAGVSIVDVTGGPKYLSGTTAKSKRMKGRALRLAWAIYATTETASSNTLFIQDRS